MSNELDFSGAYESLTEVEKYSRALHADPANAWLRRCRDGWAERLSRCLILNGIPHVGSGEASLPVPPFDGKDR